MISDLEGLEKYATQRQLEYIAALRKTGNGTQAAKLLKVNPSTLNRSMQALRAVAAKRGLSPEHDMTKTVPEGYHVKGVSTHYNRDGKPTNQWVKSQIDADKGHAVLEGVLLDKFSNIKPVKKIAAPRKTLNSDLMPVVILSDAHIGMYAEMEESGSDWDLARASRLIVDAVNHLIDVSPQSDEILIVNVGDFIHTDNTFSTTTSGSHALDTDGRWLQIVTVGLDAFVACIDFALKKYKTVRIINKGGNHDLHTGAMLNIALSRAYQNNPRVNFDMTPAIFSYLRFGKVLLGVCHGDKGAKPTQLPLIMANDRSEDWGASKYRYWYTGHLHHQRKFEPTGSNCTVETFRIMAGRDAWHQEQGYRAGREMQSIVLHREYGETGRSVVTPDMLKES